MDQLSQMPIEMDFEYRLTVATQNAHALHHEHTFWDTTDHTGFHQLIDDLILDYKASIR